MQRGVLAANVAPGVMPPFLKHIPEFRRYVRNSTTVPLGMGSDSADRNYIKSTVDNNKKVIYGFEVTDDVKCGGCVEP